MKKTVKIICLVISIVLVLAASVVILAACNGEKTIMIWGPREHEELYLEYANKYKEEHPGEFDGYKFEFDGSGDAGAYSAMTTSVENGAAIYTFANDQTANLANLGALATIDGDNLTWSKQNNDADAVESTKLGDSYVAYPLQADNGYYMYFNASAFKHDTRIWDPDIVNADGTKGNLKDGYTFRDLYAALDSNTTSAGKDSKGNDVLWKDKGKVTWALGDSWYASGVFFSVGGDYEVKYDEEGKQTSARCWFSCEEGATDWRHADFTVGDDAFQAIKNTFTKSNNDSTKNPHYVYTDGSTAALNDYISLHIDTNNTAWAEAPLAAAVCGTWKAQELKDAWGDDYRATILPTLETDNGEKFQMKNFRGYKNLGINPMCGYITDAPVDQRLERLNNLHKLAQYFCGKEMSLARHAATGAGPANNEALQDEAVAKDVALQALIRQYNLDCKYPTNYSKANLAGTAIGNGKGYRVQDSVPANYWTPISNFSQLIWNEFDSGNFSKLGTTAGIHQQLFNLQTEIQKTQQ